MAFLYGFCYSFPVQHQPWHRLWVSSGTGTSCVWLLIIVTGRQKSLCPRWRMRKSLQLTIAETGNCRLIQNNRYWLTSVCLQRSSSSALWGSFVVFWAVFYFVRTQLSLAWGIMFDRYAARQPVWVLPLQFSLPIELRLLYGCLRRWSGFPFSWFGRLFASVRNVPSVFQKILPLP